MTRSLMFQQEIQTRSSPKFFINALEPIEEAQESHDTKTGVEVSGSGSNGVHAELRDTAVDGSDARGGAQHWADSTAGA